MKRSVAPLLLLAMLQAGCNLESIGNKEFGLVAKSFETITKASREINEEEEYYVGRSVAARLLADNPLWDDSRLIAYVNRVGLTIARHSDKPVTYRDYHFAILDSVEANAFACPGGTIFITKGMLELTNSEDELAAVLAHEVAHINHRDGIAAISSSRWTEALTIIGSETAKTYGSKEMAKLTTIFEGSIDDVVKTLVVNGYGRSQEEAADRDALAYLVRAGYDPHGLEKFLERLAERGKGSKGGIFKTHPATSDRLAELRGEMPAASTKTVEARQRRFKDLFE